MVGKYMAVIHKSKYGYDVHCPALPGCASQGDTYQEAVENIKDAIRSYLKAVKKIKQTKTRRLIEVAV